MEIQKQKLEINILSLSVIQPLLPFGWRLEQSGSRLYTHPEYKKVVMPTSHTDTNSGEQMPYLAFPGNTLRLLQRICLARIDENICGEEIERDTRLRQTVAFKGYNALTVAECRQYNDFVLERERVAWSTAKGIYLKTRSEGIDLEPEMLEEEAENFLEHQLFLISQVKTNYGNRT